MQYAKMISLFPEAIWTALDNVKAGKQAKPLSASLGSYSWSRRQKRSDRWKCSKSLAPQADPANTASDRSSSLSHEPEAQFL